MQQTETGSKGRLAVLTCHLQIDLVDEPLSGILVVQTIDGSTYELLPRFQDKRLAGGRSFKMTQQLEKAHNPAHDLRLEHITLVRPLTLKTLNSLTHIES